MIPILYPASETAFTNHGYGALSDTISCTVTEERNGPYELQMTYPITGLHYADFALQRIVLAKPNFTDDPQPFRIYKITKPLNGIVTIYGQHLSYDLAGKLIQAGAGGSALESVLVLQAAAPGWTITTDKSVVANWEVTEPSSVRSWLGGKQGSILDVYGPGEWYYDGFTCSFLSARGTDRGASVRYAKNLTELSQEIDCSNLAKYVLGYYKDVDGNVVAGTLQDTGCILTDKQIAIDFSADFEEVPTPEALDAKALDYIATNNLTAPTDNIRLDFAQLGTLTDRVDLCDTVTVYYETLGVSTTAKCIKTTWDVLLGRYAEIEVGDAKTGIDNTLIAVEKAVNEAPKKTVSFVQSAINHATELITGGVGGYLKFHYLPDGTPSEMLIMDSSSESTAVNIIRFNQNGIGFSTDGGTTYSSAWTIDGCFNADFITSGVLNANLLTAGIIQDAAGRTLWNLETGEFSSYMTTELENYADEAADTAADALANALSVYIRYNNGVLELGDISSGYTARLTATELGFYDGETEVAYINNNKLFINNGQIVKDLRIGNYQWITDSTGRMSLKWVG